MKKLEIVMRREFVDRVKKILLEYGAGGIMLSNIAGYGNEEEYTQRYRGKEYTFQTIQKIRVETVVKDEIVEELLQAVTEAACTGKQGDGRIYVYDVLDAVRIRNGDRGEAAL